VFSSAFSQYEPTPVITTRRDVSGPSMTSNFQAASQVLKSIKDQPLQKVEFSQNTTLTQAMAAAPSTAAAIGSQSANIAQGKQQIESLKQNMNAAPDVPQKSANPILSGALKVAAAIVNPAPTGLLPRAEPTLFEPAIQKAKGKKALEISSYRAAADEYGPGGKKIANTTEYVNGFARQIQPQVGATPHPFMAAQDSDIYVKDMIARKEGELNRAEKEVGKVAGAMTNYSEKIGPLGVDVNLAQSSRMAVPAVVAAPAMG